MAHDTWDAVVAVGDVAAAAGWPQTVVGFWSSLDDFIAQYIHYMDLEDMRLFLDQSKKPYMMTCVEVCSCLRFLNQFVHFFQGANNTAPNNEGCMKLMFLK